MTKVRMRTDMTGASSLKYVKVQGVGERDVDVQCPFCSEVTRIPADEAEPVIAGCEHLDKEYMTPDQDGFSIWFRGMEDKDDDVIAVTAKYPNDYTSACA